MLNAGLMDKACELVERSLHDILLAGQVSLVADWMERLPQDEILRRTSLRLTVGWMLAQSERHAEAAQLVGPIIDDATADAGDRCEAAEICATAALFADDLDGMGRIVSSWYEALPTHSIQRYLVGVNQLAFADPVPRCAGPGTLHATDSCPPTTAPPAATRSAGATGSSASATSGRARSTWRRRSSASRWRAPRKTPAAAARSP